MGRGRRSRQVEIFNFSFLDVLACTIGLLIFILVMIFILQSTGPLTDYKHIIKSQAKALHNTRNQIRSTAAISATIAAQLMAMPDRRNPHLVALLAAARQAEADAAESAAMQTRELAHVQAQIDAEQVVYQQRTQVTLNALRGSLTREMARLATLQGEISTARKRDAASRIFFEPADKHAAGKFHIMHVLCTRHGLAVLHITGKGGASIGSITPGYAITDSTSAYGRAVARLDRRSAPLIIFWVYPTGVRNFNRARVNVPTDMHYGYEPAPNGWKFLLHAGGSK